MKSVKKRKGEPRMVDDATWFYIERNGISVVHEARGSYNTVLKTDIFKITWKMLDEAMTHRPKKRETP